MLNKTLALFVILLLVPSTLAVTENYYFTGSGGTGSGFTSDDLALNYDGSQATWDSNGNLATGTFTIQLTTETTINTGTMTLSLYCDKNAAQGGDQTKFDWVVYDCGTSSTCATTEATLCTGGTQLDCDNGVGTPAIETGTCTPGASGTIEANEYLGIVLTSSTNKNPDPRAYYDTATYDSNIQMDITEAAADSCTYGGSGDWTVDIEDNCDITTNEDLGANKLIIQGAAGTFQVSTGSIRAKEIHLTPDDFNGDFIVNRKNMYVEV